MNMMEPNMKLNVKLSVIKKFVVGPPDNFTEAYTLHQILDLFQEDREIILTTKTEKKKHWINFLKLFTFYTMIVIFII